MTDLPPPPDQRPDDVAPPPASLATAPPTNTMAIVSFVLGVLSFVCLWGIGGVLAIVLGAIGLGRAGRTGGEGRGLSIAGIVLGIVNLLVAIVGIVVLVLVIGEAARTLDQRRTADPSTYDLVIRDCTIDPLDRPTMTVEISNPTSSTRSFVLQYAFRVRSSAIDTGYSWPVIVSPGDTESVDISGLSTVSSATVVCEVTEVDDWFD